MITKTLASEGYLYRRTVERWKIHYVLSTKWPRGVDLFISTSLNSSKPPSPFHSLFWMHIIFWFYLPSLLCESPAFWALPPWIVFSDKLSLGFPREPTTQGALGALSQGAPVSQWLKLLMTWQHLLIQGPTLLGVILLASTSSNRGRVAGWCQSFRWWKGKHVGSTRQYLNPWFIQFSWLAKVDREECSKSGKFWAGGRNRKLDPVTGPGY